MSNNRMLIPGSVLLGIVLLVSGNAGREPAQDITTGEWAQSKDPCFPTKQFKQMIKAQFGKEAAYITCFPVGVEVEWEVEETRAWHKPYPTEKARYKMGEKFTAYCQLVYEQQKQKELEEISIIGPAPCCPGTVETWFSPEGISYLVVEPRRNDGSLASAGTFMHFAVTAPEDNFFGCTWRKSGDQSEISFGSSRVVLRDGLVKPPLSLRSGLKVVSGDSLRMSKRGTESFSYEDLLKAINDGECRRVFQTVEGGSAPSHLGAYSRTVKATVKFDTAERERWRVTVKGREEDNFQLPIRYKLAGKENEIPLKMEFDWFLEAEFTVRKVKPSPVFDSGQVKKASLSPKLLIQEQDLYRCDIIGCPDTEPIASYPGAYLEGKLDGQTLTLKWPSFDPGQCVLCKPKKSFLSQVPYREKFGSKEFMGVISKAVLVLKDGYAASGKWHDWLTYTITLKKIS